MSDLLRRGRHAKTNWGYSTAIAAIALLGFGALVRRQSDDAVRANIPAELVRVFEKVKRGVRGSPHMSRTEAFLHWVEENPDEVLAIQDVRAARRKGRRAASGSSTPHPPSSPRSAPAPQ